MDIKQEYYKLYSHYKKIGIDIDRALDKLNKIRISIHCWQGDDVIGFLKQDNTSSGIQVTGNYPGKARNISELRSDLEKVFSMVPGHHKLNLHAIYADVKNDETLSDINESHFRSWVEWAKKQKIGLDFNPTLFSNEFAKDGLTLSHPDKKIRDYWIEHVKNTRKIASYLAQELNDQVVHNIWIPDGFKDFPYSRLDLRNNLKESLDEIYQELAHKNVVDTLESKLFGVGLEGFTVGSSEFYLGYAIKNKKGICLDSGHFHPTESVADKLSSVALFVDQILLHVSRPMRWDSDHVVSYDDALQSIAEACIRDNLLDKVHVGLDFFDASINRVAAWVIGIRNTQKAFLKALLEPQELLRDFEKNLDFTSRLVLTEELKTLPIGLIYDYYCYQNNIIMGHEILPEIKKYEEKTVSERKL